jgi:hypothetical protein
MKIIVKETNPYLISPLCQEKVDFLPILLYTLKSHSLIIVIRWKFKTIIRQKQQTCRIITIITDIDA